MSWLNYYEEPITLHSGDKSHWKIDGDELFDDEEIRGEVISYWARMITHYYKHRTKNPRIFGIPRGGTKWAEELARNIPGAVLLNEYEDAEYVEPTFLIDDVATTGSSFDKYPNEPRYVVVRRLSTGNMPHVQGAFMDIHLPLVTKADAE